MSNKVSVSVGSPVVGLLGILFIALKLTHTIDWSWWWVLCPFWVGFAFTCAVLLFCLFCVLTAAITGQLK